jgi:threonine efflux protein
MMFDTSVLWTFTLLWMVIVPTPGANVLMLSQLALTRPRREVAIALAGNLLGVALWAIAALLGLSVLLAAFPAARLAIHLLGGAYLVWFGLQLIRRSFVATASIPERQGKPFVIGLATALSNAQAVFFITSIFAVAGVINADAATSAVVVVIMMACNGVYLWFLASVLMRAGPRRVYARWRATLERLFGSLFLFFGGHLVWKALRG